MLGVIRQCCGCRVQSPPIMIPQTCCWPPAVLCPLSVVCVCLRERHLINKPLAGINLPTARLPHYLWEVLNRNLKWDTVYDGYRWSYWLAMCFTFILRPAEDCIKSTNWCIRKNKKTKISVWFVSPGVGLLFRCLLFWIQCLNVISFGGGSSLAYACMNVCMYVSMFVCMYAWMTYWDKIISLLSASQYNAMLGLTLLFLHMLVHKDIIYAFKILY